MSESEKKYLQKWDENVARGKATYSITYGLLWGMFTAIISQLLIMWGAADVLASFMTTDFLIRCAVFILGGIGMYALVWNSNLKKYKQLKSKQGTAKV